MGRPRMFDETAVLDAAVGEFRVHGFADTSTEQLCDASGVRRSSLYNTFESKDELFVRALERYVSVTGQAQEAALTDESASGAERLRALLDLVVTEERDAAVRGHAAGCMVVGSRMTPDLGTRDERIKTLLDRALERQTSLLVQAVRMGRLDGSLRHDLDPHTAALTVITLISGLRVLAQAGAGSDELRGVADLALSTLLP